MSEQLNDKLLEFFDTTMHRLNSAQANRVKAGYAKELKEWKHYDLIVTNFPCTNVECSKCLARMGDPSVCKTEDWALGGISITSEDYCNAWDEFAKDGFQYKPYTQEIEL